MTTAVPHFTTKAEEKEAYYQKVEAVELEIKALNQEIEPLRRKVLWTGTKEEKEQIGPYLSELKSDLVKLEKDKAYWSDLLRKASVTVSMSRHKGYKESKAVTDARTILNKVATFTHPKFKFPLKDDDKNPGYGDVMRARKSKDHVYRDTEGKSLSDFYDSEEWRYLDRLNQEVNGMLHDDFIPVDPKNMSVKRVNVPERFYVEGRLERVLGKCGVDNVEVVVPFHDSSGSEGDTSPDGNSFK